MPSSQSFMRGTDETWIMHCRKSLPGIRWMLQWGFRLIKNAEAGKEMSGTFRQNFVISLEARVGIEPKTTLRRGSY